MKTPIFLTCLFTLLFTSCSGYSQVVEITPTVITVEITRIVQITTTPVPTETVTPAPTLDAMDIGGTAVAKEIGTPIVASKECYRTAQTQSELNGCAGGRLQELDNHMSELLKSLEAQYQQRLPKRLEKLQKFQAEWKDLSDRECKFRSGLDSDSWPGTMASMNYSECMVAKYEARLRELQGELFDWNQ